MTMARGRIAVRGYTPAGALRFETSLTHGWSPNRVLRAGGWRPVALRGYRFEEGAQVVLEYSVLPATTQGRSVVDGSSSTDPGVQVTSEVTASGDEAGPSPRQRLAAYAVVRSDEGVLLTELSTRTSRAGLWVLPGGGVEEGEDPSHGVLREVWEESGQQVTLGPLIEVSSSHRVGDFHGELEDFHAVRMIFSAVCEHPEPLIVHDAEGSTGRAKWFSSDEILDPQGAAIPGGMAPWSLDAVRKVVCGHRTSA